MKSWGCSKVTFWAEGDFFFSLASPFPTYNEILFLGLAEKKKK